MKGLLKKFSHFLSRQRNGGKDKDIFSIAEKVKGSYGQKATADVLHYALDALARLNFDRLHGKDYPLREEPSYSSYRNSAHDYASNHDPESICRAASNYNHHCNPFWIVLYLWPTWIPEDLLLSPSDSYGDEHGFTLEFKKPYALMSIKGGPPAIKDWDLFHEDGKPITVRDHEGYYFGTGGGFGIQWQENGHPFYVGGPGMSFEDAAKIAESLEIIDLSTLQKRLEPDTRYEAVYLVQGQGVLSQDDLNAHPEVLVVHSLFEFRRHSQTKIALLIDKNAIDVLQGYSMEEEVFENDPVVLVGYADPMYSFHDVLQLDSKFGGPSEGYLYGPTKDPNLIEPGFSVWILPVGMQDRKDAMTTGFQKTPTVQNILDITNPLLEGKMPNGFEKCCPDR